MTSNAIVAEALREGLIDNFYRMAHREAEREAYVSALTPVVERLLAEQTKELRDRDKTISRQLERRASGNDPATVAERERADAAEARAAEAERRLREIRELADNWTRIPGSTGDGWDRVLALLDTGAGQG